MAARKHSDEDMKSVLIGRTVAEAAALLGMHERVLFGHKARFIREGWKPDGTLNAAREATAQTYVITAAVNATRAHAGFLDLLEAQRSALVRRQALRVQEAELVRSRQGLTRDGLLARGGSIERLRLPAAGDLRIGASDNRARLRVLHEEIDKAERDVREIEPRLRRDYARWRFRGRLPFRRVAGHGGVVLMDRVLAPVGGGH